MSAHGILCRWNLSSLSPQEIDRATGALISDVKAAYDRVAEVKLEDVGLDNVIRALIEIERDNATREGPLDFAQHCATSKVRKKSNSDISKFLDIKIYCLCH